MSNAVPVGVPRDALSGTWLGHALHPLLTDVVIGSFLSTTLLDLLGGHDSGRARERLIEVGLVTAAPAVAIAHYAKLTVNGRAQDGLSIAERERIRLPAGFEESAA